MNREGFGIRLGAMLIDGLILAAIGWVLTLIFGGTISALMGRGGGVNAQGQVIAVSIALLVGWFLIVTAYWLTEVFMAASPGKQVLGLTIAAENGTRAGTDQLLKRWLFKNAGNLLQTLGAIVGVGIIITLGGLWALVVFIGCFFTLGATRQAFHDRFAKTAVFKKALVHQTAQAGFPVMQPTAPPPPPPAAV